MSYKLLLILLLLTIMKLRCGKISPDTQDIDAGMANWDSTNFDRKIAYMATQQRAVSAEHQEQQAATHPPADAPKKKTPTPQQPKQKSKPTPPPPFGPGPVMPPFGPSPKPSPPPFGPGPVMPPFGPSPKPSPPDPGIATLLVASLSSNWVGNMKDNPEKWGKQYKSFCPPASAAACTRAIKNHCFMHGDPGCDKSHDAFWDICEHDANCVKNMWHYSLDKDQKDKISEQAKKDGRPSKFPQDLCKDTGLCNKPIKSHSHAKKSVAHSGKGGKKTSQKPATTEISGKAQQQQQRDQEQKPKNQPKMDPIKELRGRSGGVQREYPHIKNHSLAANLAGGYNPNLNDPGVAFWNMPGPIGGGASALQYYNPQFLDDYSSVAGIGSYFQPPQQVQTTQNQPIAAVAPRQQQSAAIQSLPGDDQPSRAELRRRQEREQERAAAASAASSTGGGGKWWHPHLFGAHAPKKYTAK